MKKITKKNLIIVLDLLDKEYPNPKSELNYSNEFELLIATILSAQCTDKRVNSVTEVLFERNKTPDDIIKLSIDELETIIKSCGFYRMKSKNIMNTCKILIDKYNGEVPSSLDELIKLPGVGKKTANVVLSNAFDIPAFAVDTHVSRLSNRIGIIHSKNVDEIEEALMKRIPKEKWSKAHHWLILHGRRVCKSRKPNCLECVINQYCTYNKKTF